MMSIYMIFIMSILMTSASVLRCLPGQTLIQNECKSCPAGYVSSLTPNSYCIPCSEKPDTLEGTLKCKWGFRLDGKVCTCLCPTTHVYALNKTCMHVEKNVISIVKALHIPPPKNTSQTNAKVYDLQNATHTLVYNPVNVSYQNMGKVIFPEEFSIFFYLDLKSYPVNGWANVFTNDIITFTVPHNLNCFRVHYRVQNGTYSTEKYQDVPKIPLNAPTSVNFLVSFNKFWLLYNNTIVTHWTINDQNFNSIKNQKRAFGTVPFYLGSSILFNATISVLRIGSFDIPASSPLYGFKKTFDLEKIQKIQFINNTKPISRKYLGSIATTKKFSISFELNWKNAPSSWTIILNSDVLTLQVPFNRTYFKIFYKTNKDGQFWNCPGFPLNAPTLVTLNVNVSSFTLLYNSTTVSSWSVPANQTLDTSTSLYTLGGMKDFEVLNATIKGLVFKTLSSSADTPTAVKSNPVATTKVEPEKAKEELKSTVSANASKNTTESINPKASATPNTSIKSECKTLYDVWDVLDGDDKITLPENCCEFKGITCNSNQSHIISIDWSNTDLNGKLPKSIQRLTQLIELNLSENQITGSLVSTVTKLSKLETLDLEFNRFTGRLPTTLGELKALKKLVLGHNAFGGPLPKQLTELAELEVLDLRNNQFKGEIPKGFEKLKKLKTLSLRYNQLNGVVPYALTELPALETLYLDNNKFKGKFPTLNQVKNCRAKSNSRGFCYTDAKNICSLENKCS